MVWTYPEYNRRAVDEAGTTLASSNPALEYLDPALEVLNNWRASHSFPLNTLQMLLRGRARSVYSHALVAQRLKRVPSVIDKLRRLPTMRLSQMQDIGGCRAVVRSVRQLERLKSSFDRLPTKHTRFNEKDYVARPAISGYRSIHLIYRFSSDRNPEFNGHLIELQLRSQLQHAWATAVETVGTFLQQSLKASMGSEDWLRFFALASAAFAHEEGTPAVPETPRSKRTLRAELRRLGRTLDVEQTLTTFRTALDVTTGAPRLHGHYYLLSLQPAAERLSVHTYTRDQLGEATAAYLAEEKRLRDEEDGQVVLVAADSLRALRSAYPNYFLDTQVFFRALHNLV